VPAAAVIPAPRAYMQVAAVEKLVVGFRVSELDSPLGSLPVVCCPDPPSEDIYTYMYLPITLKNFECFRQASYWLEELSME
jgi:hypothetical protein